MRFLLALAGCANLVAGDSALRLRQLEENNRLFELRTELDRQGGNAAETMLYRAILASRFGAERDAIGQLRKFLATKPAADLERKARYELSWALTRLGEYGQAAIEVASELRLSVGAPAAQSERENVRRILEAWRDVPRQTVDFGAPAPVQARRNAAGLWEVPVEVNSQRGEWILDTGANFSTVSESEARRMGLAIREVNGHTRDFGGASHLTHLAVAGELRFGSARLRNVVFLVLADESLVFTALKPIRGILGLPAIRALERVDVSADGVIAFGKSAPAPRTSSNFFFDGLDPITTVAHSGHRLQMMLDTGAVTTVLYPAVLDAFAQWERDQLKGANGSASAQREADLVPFIQLEAPGKTVYLERVALLRRSRPGSPARDGVLGVDALKGGFSIDFRAMRFWLN